MQDKINLLFFFKATSLARVLLPYIIDRGASYGTSSSDEHLGTNGTAEEKKKIVVEFSSPNLGKAFDGLHLRSSLIGAFLCSAYERMGWEVYKMNFLGDWGKNVGMLTAGWSRFGSEEDLEKEPLAHLLEVHAKTEALLKEQQSAAKLEDGEAPTISEIETERDQRCKQLEESDPNTHDLWKRFRELCIAKYAEQYARLGITFDEYSGESQISKEIIEEAETTLKEKGVYHEKPEGWFVEFSKPDEKGLGSVKGRSSDGTTSYLLRDIGAALDRNRKHSFDKMIYVVSPRQTAHFQQVLKALELMDLSELAQKLEHFSFGEVHGLSAKEGASGLLSDILDQCRHATKLAVETDQDASGCFFGHDPAAVAETLGVMNLMVSEQLCRRTSTFDFDLNVMATPGDYTALDLQKWYTTLSIRLSGVNIGRADLQAADYIAFEDEPQYADLMKLLLQYPSMVKTWAFEKLDPSHVLMFLFSIIEQMPSIWEEETEAEGSSQSLAKLALYTCVHHTLENGIRLLGLNVVKI